MQYKLKDIGIVESAVQWTMPSGVGEKSDRGCLTHFAFRFALHAKSRDPFRFGIQNQAEHAQKPA